MTKEKQKRQVENSLMKLNEDSWTNKDEIVSKHVDDDKRSSEDEVPIQKQSIINTESTEHMFK